MIRFEKKSPQGPENPRVKEKPLAIDNVVERVNKWSEIIEGKSEENREPWSDEKLAAKTDEFRSRLERGETLDDILPEAFAVVRRVAEKKLGKRPYDVQVEASFVLHQGQVADMKTGEGKTLAATMAVYLNALQRKGVHVITTNDRLARRDAREMATIYSFLGLSSGVLQGTQEGGERERGPAFLVEAAAQNQLQAATRKEAYQADITYGTKDEFGFDYLRDSMALSKTKLTQRGHNFAVVDEVDKALLDDASTPLKISGEMAPTESKDYQVVSKAVKKLTADHYELKKDKGSVTLTAAGEEFLNKELCINLSQTGVAEIIIPKVVHKWGLIQKALEAEFLLELDKDYLLWPHPTQPGKKQIEIISTEGWLQFGQSWSDGLLQAVEAKEGLPISAYSQTFESITIQSYMQLYDKLSGMTGSTAGAEEELWKIYDLEIVCIETKEKIIRKDKETAEDEFGDLLFFDRESKLDAMAEAIAELHVIEAQAAELQPEIIPPVLSGNHTIRDSAELNKRLRKLKLDPDLLNAYNYTKADKVVSEAGEAAKITVTTEMLGRGADIKLGGMDATEQAATAVKTAGGLHVFGSRSALRRKDDQLKGRAGRQGEPGSVRFFVSLQDNFLVEYAHANEDFRLFWNDHRNTKGAVTDPKVKAQFLEFIDKAQEWHASVGFSQREQLKERSEFPNKQRLIFNEGKSRTMEMSEEELDQKLLRIVDFELKRKLKEMADFEGHQLHPQVVKGFMSWLERIQPTLELQGEIMPSFGLNLFIQKAMRRAGVESLEGLKVPASARLEKAIWEMKAELFNHEQKIIMKNIKKVFGRTNFFKKAEVENLIKFINALVPEEIYFEYPDLKEDADTIPKLDQDINPPPEPDILKFVSKEKVLGVVVEIKNITTERLVWVELKAGGDKDKPEKMLFKETVDAEKIWEFLEGQLDQVFADKKAEEVGEYGDFASSLMLAIRFGMLGANSPYRKGLSKTQVMQLAARTFSENGRIKSKDWWMVQDEVEKVSIEDLGPAIGEHLERSLEFSTQFWEPVKEHQQFITSVEFKRKALLASQLLAWMEYLDNLAKLQITTGLGQLGQSNPDGVYAAATNDLFEEMLGNTSKNMARLLFPAGKIVDLPAGELTEEGSYTLEAHLRRLVAQSDLFEADSFARLIENLQWAFLARDGHAQVYTLLADKPDNYSDFYEQFMKIINRQIVVFPNEFIGENTPTAGNFEEKILGVDVAFSSRVQVPIKVNVLGEDGKKEWKTLDRETKLYLSDTTKEILHLQALRRRYQELLAGMKTMGQKYFFDPYGGVEHSPKTVKENMKTLEDKIDILISEIWEKLE